MASHLHFDKLIMAAEDMIQATGTSFDLSPVAALLREITGAKLVTINLYEDDLTVFRFAAIAGDPADLAIMRDLTGEELTVGKKMRFTPHRPSLPYPFEITEVESFKELAAGELSPEVCEAVSEKLGLGRIVLARLVDKDQLIGNFTIYLSAGQKLAETSAVKLLSRQVSLTLARLRAEQTVARLLREMTLIFDSTQDALFLIEVTDAGKFIYRNANQAMLAMCSIPNQTIAGLTPEDLFGEVEVLALLENLRRCQISGNRTVFEHELPSPAGQRNWLITLSPIDDEGHVRFIAGSARDVTAERQSRRQIEYLSYHDRLTGLYNRHYYEDTLKRLDTGRSLPLAILMADVNGLKMSNDVFGHPFGDSLLRQAANVMARFCRAEDIIARVGGDEFEIIFPRTTLRETEKIADRIREATADVRVGPVQLSISIGCAVKTNQYEDIQNIRKQAEDNMYRLKTVESPLLKNKIIQIIRHKVSENPFEERHANRCAAMCEAMAEALGLNSREKAGLRQLGLLHDIGKIILPLSIVEKTTPLTEPEWDEIRRHSEASYRILSAVNEYAILAEYALAHHEHWDGSGYPRRLRGDEIPYWSRILTIVDAFESMTSRRPWRPAYDFDYAVRELRSGAGRQFDPDLSELFLSQVAPRFMD